MVSSIGGSNKSGSLIRYLTKARSSENKANERLASGKRINSAKDDAAGLAIANALAANVAKLGTASRNATDGQSLIQIAEGAVSQLSDINIRQQELAAQAANGTLSDEQRQALEQERSALEQEADRIIASTEFNGKKVFSGESTTIQAGTGSDASSQISIPSIDPSTLVNRDSIGTQEEAQSALDSLKSQEQSITSQRGTLGAVSSRLEVSKNRSEDSRVEEESARSRITDADIAQEVANAVSSRIIQQGAASAIQTNNLSAENVLKLLR